ncbi:hypothetical protein BRC90_12105 [Halobacteriales archaeon QS_4_69_34]|nr:MAG: hypothetical protein BRC90_12105 [Halobacteriales archaeon QS_4_69_34]
MSLTANPYTTSISRSSATGTWPALSRAERDRLEGRIGDRVVAIEHFGSTSVPGLAATPIIDICPVVPAMDAACACKPAMLDLGYRFSAEREDWLAFERRDDADQQYSVRFHPLGSTRLERVLIFRDYLRDHPHARKHLRDRQALRGGRSPRGHRRV